jgi:hypothetical protein
MKRQSTLRHQFVEYIPDDLEDGTLYVSVPFATAIHKCCCGCGRQVVTPLSPTDWKLIFDGVSVSLDPSIGNWNFPCQSHYWIRRNAVSWAPRWTQKEIDLGRAKDRRLKHQYFDNGQVGDPEVEMPTITPEQAPRKGIWSRLRGWLSGSK